MDRDGYEVHKLRGNLLLTSLRTASDIRAEFLVIRAGALRRSFFLRAPEPDNPHAYGVSGPPGPSDLGLVRLTWTLAAMRSFISARQASCGAQLFAGPYPSRTAGCSAITRVVEPSRRGECLQSQVQRRMESGLLDTAAAAGLCPVAAGRRRVGSTARCFLSCSCASRGTCTVCFRIGLWLQLSPIVPGSPSRLQGERVLLPLHQPDAERGAVGGAQEALQERPGRAAGRRQLVGDGRRRRRGPPALVDGAGEQLRAGGHRRRVRRGRRRRRQTAGRQGRLRALPRGVALLLEVRGTAGPPVSDLSPVHTIDTPWERLSSVLKDGRAVC